MNMFFEEPVRAYFRCSLDKIRRALCYQLDRTVPSLSGEPLFRSYQPLRAKQANTQLRLILIQNFLVQT